MSVDVNVYVGPYLDVPQVTLTRPTGRVYCHTSGCGGTPPAQARFCPRCGHPVHTETVTKLGYPRLDELTSADTKELRDVDRFDVWLPWRGHFGKTHCINSALAPQPLTPDDLAAELARFSEYFAPLRAAFAAQFGQELPVRYGVVTYYS